MTIDEFKKEIREHKTRVKTFAHKFIKLKGIKIDIDIFNKFIALHDDPKFKHIDDLFKHYGKGMSDDLKKIVDTINYEEQKLKEQFNIYPDYKSFIYVEYVADLIDRGLHGEREFGRKMILASDMIETDLAIIRQLEIK